MTKNTELMDFDQFCQYIIERIKEYLPEKYKDAEIIEKNTEKLNEKYVGFILYDKEQEIFPTINLTGLYEVYCQGEEVEEILRKTAKSLMTRPEQFDTQAFLDYEKVKKNLFIRVSSLEPNLSIVNTVPHMHILDMIITYHVAVYSNGEFSGSVMITNDLLHKYRITKEDLHSDAMRNSQRILPVKIAPIEKIIQELISNNVIEERSSKNEKSKYKMIVVSNDTGINGASALFYPNTMKRLSKMVDGNYFILPSSIHEVIVVPDDGTMEFNELNAMIEEINVKEVAKNDVLSNQCYYYDAELNLIETGKNHFQRK